MRVGAPFLNAAGKPVFFGKTAEGRKLRPSAVRIENEGT